MSGLGQRILNAFGLHTEAELNAARRGGAEPRAEASGDGVPRRLTPAEALFRRTEEDIVGMPVSLQVQAKARAIDQYRKMAERSAISADEFESRKRRVLSL